MKTLQAVKGLKSCAAYAGNTYVTSKNQPLQTEVYDNLRLIEVEVQSYFLRRRMFTNVSI